MKNNKKDLIIKINYSQFYLNNYQQYLKYHKAKMKINKSKMIMRMVQYNKAIIAVKNFIRLFMIQMN